MSRPIKSLKDAIPLDRGLFPPAVQSYANIHGLTYEQAHQRLSGGWGAHYQRAARDEQQAEQEPARRDITEPRTAMEF